MKKKFILYFMLAASLVTGCSSSNQKKDNLPCIDITKNYPEKEIILTDIATVKYVHLSTKNDDYLYKGIINYMTENTIVVADDVSGSILFFSKDGKPKSRFNHYGSGSEEYPQKGRFLSIIYDETADDVFVSSTPGNFNVYSSMGKYKRKVILPQGTNVHSIVDYDEQSFFLYDIQNDFKKSPKERTYFMSQSNDSSYCRVSKTDGKVLEYVIFPSIEINLTNHISVGNGWLRRIHPHGRIVKSPTGLYFCRIDADTVFLYKKDKTVTPVFCKTPLANKSEPIILLNRFIETDRYQFIEVLPLAREDSSSETLLLRDKQSGKIFQQKLILPDYKEKKLTFLVICITTM